MTRKHVIIDGEDFFLEPLSPSVVKVEYKDRWGGSVLARSATSTEPSPTRPGHSSLWMRVLEIA